MLRTWCRLSKTNATTPGQALYCRHVASTEALAVPRAPGQMRAFRWRSFNPKHAANFGYFAPIWRKVPPRFLQQSDVCFCFRSELLLLRDRLQLWKEFWPVSDRCRLDHNWSIPTPHVSLRWRATYTWRARCQRAAECCLWTACKWEVSVLAEETSSVNTEEIFVDVTFTVRAKFTLKLPVVDMKPLTTI
jgi:hypothetical protein